jgi:hypothetical protein
MVLVDELPWHEMDVDGELVLRCEDRFCRDIEQQLRRTLYAWNHMRTDLVVRPVVTIPKAIRTDGFGLHVEETTLATDPASEVLSHRYGDQLATERDLQRIRVPSVWLDERATAEAEERAHEILDGFLSIEMQGCLPGFELWDRIVEWRGAESVLFDLADRPGFMHETISRVTDAHLGLIDELERKGLLGDRQATIVYTAAFTDELPAPGYDPLRPRAIDLWTSGAAQILGSVSPRMHEEFELESAQRWATRFGLVYYGCCEPLHDRIDMVRRIPNVRKISISPFADVERSAEQIGHDFVFSRKPSPFVPASDEWDPGRVEEDLRAAIAACDRHGCPLELILKDLSTVRHRPERLWEWAAIAMRLVS